MSSASRNRPCSCGSGRKFKRCCGPALDSPARLGKEHSAVGARVQAWAFETYPEEMRAGLDEVLGHRKGGLVGDADLQLAGTWVLSDRELPGGGTLSERYAQRLDMPASERDIAERIAAARLGLLRVLSVSPGRGIELQDLTRGEFVWVVSHDLSRSVEPGDVFVGRVMAGPPARSVWGPVAFVTRRTGQMLSDVIKARMLELDVCDQPQGLAIAMNAASREIVSLFLPPLRNDPTVQQAA
jgi:SEC-C motif